MLKTSLDLSKYRAIIFDVDGTLFDLKKARVKMLLKMFGHYLLRPWNWKDMLIIQTFRQNREGMRENVTGDLQNSQYSQVAAKLHVSKERVAVVIQRWILLEPLTILKTCRYEGINEFFSNLKSSGRTIGIFSDYPVKEKLEALGLSADVCVSATDPEVDKFKPDPKGLEVATSKIGKPLEECLYIGDREEVDAVCAKAAGMDCLIIGKDFSTYKELSNALHLH